MADRQPNSGRGSQGSDSAQETVFDNLGLSAEDLGVDSGADDLEGDEGEQEQQEQYIEPERERPAERLDDLSVSHTRSGQGRQAEPRPFARSAEVQPDQQGNLVDPQTGQIVARAGREASLYQRGFKSGENAKVGGLQYRLTQRENQLRQAIDAGKKLSDEVKNFRTQQESLKQYRITPEDQLAAYKLYSDLRARPSDTLKALLTRAAATGINVAELGVPGLTGADAKSLVDMVREEIGKVTTPIEERNRQEREQQAERDRHNQEQQRVESEVQGFFAENPQAQRYITVFEKVLANPEFRHMSLGEIWARIQLNELRSGQKDQAPNRQNRGRFPRLSGRGAPPARNNEGPAPISMTYDEILRGVLKDHNV